MDLYKSAPLIILLPSPSVLSPQTNSICMRTNYILKNNFPSVLTQFLNVCIGYNIGTLTFVQSHVEHPV